MAHPYKSIIQGLNEAVEYQQAKIAARKTRLTIRPVMEFDTGAIREIRRKTGLSQVMFALSLGVSPKTVEAWECGRNRPEGASRRLLELVNENPDFLTIFQQRKIDMKPVTEYMNDSRILNDPDMVGALEPIVGQVHYYVMCISAFAKAKGINVKDAFNYLHAYKGIEFLVECYDAEHTLSLENAVEDLTRICGNNGGNIA